MEKIDAHRYSELFSGKEKDALEIALATRKFEIELYWKRATYFWAFIATTFGGYVALLNHHFLLIFISSIGLFFSLGWHLVNRGSKYWQENWETHVSMLESKINMPLFECVLIPKDSFFNPKGHYPFSVSKVNQILSFIVSVFWFLIFLFSTLSAFPSSKRIIVSLKRIITNETSLFIPILITGIVLFLSFLFLYFSQSYLRTKKRVKNNKYIFLKK